MVAHSDDWQLFMGVNAFKDIASGTKESGRKVVIIYTTAGDASYGGPYKIHYADARERGADRSVQFCSDAYSPHSAWSSSLASVVSGYSGSFHNILRRKYKNVVCYYLRLPDGCLETKGITTLSKFERTYGARSAYNYCSTCWGSTAPLTVPSISDIDGNTTYTSYSDLKQTILGILALESSGISEIWMNAQETDYGINPGDHPDHISTGFLAQDIAKSFNSCCNIASFVDYHCSALPDNLTPEEISMEAALQSQASFGLSHAHQGIEWDPKVSGHVKWTASNYFRIIKNCPDTQSNAGDPVNEKFIKLFPNPATSIINLSYNIFEEGIIEIALFDVFGKQLSLIVKEKKGIGNYSFEFNTEKLIPGNYMLHMKTSKYTKSIPFTKVN